MKKLLLIDGHSILNRAFFGIPSLTDAEGHHTNAVYGFLNIMFKNLDELKPDYLAVAFDLPSPTFRHKMYADYKGNRKPPVPEFREQIPLMKDVLNAMGITFITKEGYEADDILGTMSKMGEDSGIEVVVLSGDRDLLQLASEKTLIRIPKTMGGGNVVEDYHSTEVKEKYGVTPKEFIDLKALMGDSSDNIPGLPGVGEKTATKIITQFGSIENAHEHADEIKPNKAMLAMKEHYDLAVLSKELATIERNVPLETSFNDLAINDFFTPEAYELFKKLGFKQFLTRFEYSGKSENEEITYKTVETKTDSEKIFENISTDVVGVCFEGDEYPAMAAICTDKNYIIKFNDEVDITYFYGLIDGISKEKTIASCDVKYLLKYVELSDDTKIFDAVVGAYINNPLKSDYDYDDIAVEYLNRNLPSEKELLGKNKKADLLKKTEVAEAVTKIAVYKAYTAAKSYKPIRSALENNNMISIFDNIEMPLVFTLSAMEKEGIILDLKALEEYGEKLESRILELTQSIYEQAGEEFNINSPKQLGVILFENLGMPGGKKTKTGYSTSAQILEKLAPEYPFVNDILEYRQLTKLKSTYVDGLSGYVDKNSRIHTNFNQTITATGRLSSTEPNLQNIPIRMELGRLIRKCFIPAEGNVFVDADYSQIELRILAHMSKDEKLIDAYRTNKDIHASTASQVFHVPYDEVTPEMRRNAKAVNFGIVYGISSFGLGQGLSISQKEAKAYINDYFKTYPQVKEFIDGLVKSANEKGYAESIFGRRRPIPELKSGNFMTRSFGERIAMNSPLQGSAADIMKIAMNNVYHRLKRENLRSRLILQIHDELLIEAVPGEVETVSKLLVEEMENAAQLAVKLEVECCTGKNWYEAK